MATPVGGAREPVVVICATAIAITFLLVVGTLLYFNRDTASLMSIVNTILNSSGLAAAVGALFYANKSAKQTNGNLDLRIEEAVQRVVNSNGRQVLQRPGLNRDGGASDNGGQPPDIGNSNPGNG